MFSLVPPSRMTSMEKKKSHTYSSNTNSNFLHSHCLLQSCQPSRLAPVLSKCLLVFPSLCLPPPRTVVVSLEFTSRIKTQKYIVIMSFGRVLKQIFYYSQLHPLTGNMGEFMHTKSLFSLLMLLVHIRFTPWKKSVIPINWWPQWGSPPLSVSWFFPFLLGYISLGWEPHLIYLGAHHLPQAPGIILS